jgi:LAO/AO transport system kinase
MSRYDTNQLWERFIRGDLRSLSQMITLVESEKPELRIQAETLLKKCLQRKTNSIRIGISGAPGVGKSTFIEQFGLHTVNKNHRLAVLAVDPSSPVSGGSILGDRIRMEELSRHPQAFIRPSPAGKQLGGVSRYTRESIIVCEAFGFDRIFIETVGVGQSEVEVASMVDFFLILQQPYTGDDIQGLKKGVLELADMIAVTKGDGDLLLPAQLTRQRLQHTLSIAHSLRPGIHDDPSDSTQVFVVSGKTGEGISNLYEALDLNISRRKEKGIFNIRRMDQSISWFKSEINEQLQNFFLKNPKVRQKINDIELKIKKDQAIPSLAAKDLIHNSIIIN